MNTAYEILFLWVARMIMFGLYLENKPPFEIALINGVLRDEKGNKMSKSKGNGVNPNDAIEKYGADAVRMALVASRDNGNDMLISKQQMEERIRGYRNFSNKIWNAARFVQNFQSEAPPNKVFQKRVFEGVPFQITQHLEASRLGLAAEGIYDFFWHNFCDIHIEQAKSGEIGAAQLRAGFEVMLKLLHPFMPFVTEAVWQELKLGEDPLMTSAWPKSEPPNSQTRH